jgi:hypothetical protein
MSVDALAGWFAVMFSLTLAGVLLVRVVAMRAERRMLELRIERARRSSYVVDASGYILDDFDRAHASLRPFMSWILVAFVSGAAVMFLAQRLASSAEPTTMPVASSAVAANASSTTTLPAIEDMPASEESGPVSSLGDTRPSLLATQVSGSRDDPASSIRSRQISGGSI